MVTLGTTNNATGFAVVFSETVNMQLGGWSNLLIPNEFRPDETVKYINFTFNVDIQPTNNETSLSFGVQQSNGVISMYKATFDQVSGKWTLKEIKAP